MDFIQSHFGQVKEFSYKYIPDERGVFAKPFHARQFSVLSFDPVEFVEDFYSISKQGVLRGMHFQLPPQAHTKLVYCPIGEVLDVVVDLRKKSSTYGHAAVVELSAQNHRGLLIPEGFAHGFYTVSADAMVCYKVSTLHDPALDAGIHWSSVADVWPDVLPLVSPRDENQPMLADFESPF